MSRADVSRVAVAHLAVLAVVGVASFAACTSDGSVEPTGPAQTTNIPLSNRSVTPPLVKNVATGVGVYSLLSSDDTLAASPSFIFGGTTDGAGLLKNADGTFTLVVNNEDNFSVSRIKLDPNFKPISGDYLMNSDGGRWRLCSATLATPDEHGFGPLFITAGESGTDPMIHGIDPLGAKNSSKLLSGLGKWLAENAVPLPKTAYAGKTVVLIGDDDSGAPGGQIGMYVSGTVGDLDNGSLYVMVRADGVTRERDMVVGKSYAVVFRKVDDQKTLSSNQLTAKVTELGAVAFGRVEDLDYRKGGGANGREVYFNVTGQNTTGVNADFSRTRKGRIYHLVLDAADPTRGMLDVVLDGDDASGPAKLLQNPDNITATQNYLYISEDPNEYGDETHDSYLWQYNLTTKEFKPIFEVDHRRTDAKFGGQSPTGSWENSGMIDISDQLGMPGTFLIGVQAHSWHNARFRGVDGGALRTTEDQGSQLLVLTGLPR
jgi:hypothetical protein